MLRGVQFYPSKNNHFNPSNGFCASQRTTNSSSPSGHLTFQSVERILRFPKNTELIIPKRAFDISIRRTDSALPKQGKRRGQARLCSISIRRTDSALPKLPEREPGTPRRNISIRRTDSALPK